MEEIARFYGITVSMDKNFHGKPVVLFDYEEDHLEGYFDLEKGEFIDDTFPKYVIRVIREWIDDHIQILRAMWSEKQIAMLPEWE